MLEVDEAVMPPEVGLALENGPACLDEVSRCDEVVVECHHVRALGEPDPDVSAEGDVAIADRIARAPEAKQADG